MDDDLGNLVDLIDEVFLPVQRAIPANSGIAQTISGVNNIASLTLESSYTCAQPNSYGQNCSAFCQPNDDDTNGHYTCNSATGAKVCLAGYKDPSTNCLNAIQALSTPPSSTMLPVIPLQQTSSTSAPVLQRILLTEAKVSSNLESHALTSVFASSSHFSSIKSRQTNIDHSKDSTRFTLQETTTIQQPFFSPQLSNIIKSSGMTSALVITSTVVVLSEGTIIIILYIIIVTSKLLFFFVFR